MIAQNRFLPEWFNRIRIGQLRLPRFQRHEAWGQNEVSSVLEAVLGGLPVGATLVLQVGDQELFHSRPMIGTPPPQERAIEQLLDGQQRLTALWRALNDLYDDRTYFVYFEQDDEHSGQEATRVYGQARWKKNGRRYPMWSDDAEQVHQRDYIPLTLLRPGDLAQEVGAWCDRAVAGDLAASRLLERRIQSLRERVTTYNIPYLELPVGTPKDIALDVFIKMNTSSVHLTTFDILVAQVEEATGESLHALLGMLEHEVPAVLEYVDPEDLILNAAALREDRAPTQASAQLLDLTQLVAGWEELVRGVRWAVQCIEEECVFDGKRLPTVAVLPVVTALHDVVPGALDARGNARIFVRKYLWRSFLTGRYEHAAATRAFQDFRALRALLQGQGDAASVPVFDEAEHQLPSLEELVQAGWPNTRDSLARAILGVTLKAGARDIADGERVSRTNIRRREYHHLFPDSLLTQDGGLTESESYRALNCALITWQTNRNIAAKEPLEYLHQRVTKSVLGEEDIRSRLATHLVPYDKLAVGGYARLAAATERAARIKADYQAFLDARAARVVEAIKALCAGTDWPTHG